MSKPAPQPNSSAVSPNKGGISAGIVHREVVEHSGPLPHPQVLAAYSQIVPNGAERIVRMAEAQAQHRMEIEKHVIYSQQSQLERGQVFGLIAVLACIGYATYAAISGRETFASVLAGTTVVSLAGAFVSGKILQKRDLAEKARSSQEAS